MSLSGENGAQREGRELERAPGEHGKYRKGEKGKLPHEKRDRQFVIVDLSSGAALARLSRKLGHVTFVAPEWNLGVGHSHTLLRWEGKKGLESLTDCGLG